MRIGVKEGWIFLIPNIPDFLGIIGAIVALVGYLLGTSVFWELSFVKKPVQKYWMGLWNLHANNHLQLPGMIAIVVGMAMTIIIILLD